MVPGRMIVFYDRGDPHGNEAAFREGLPALYLSSQAPRPEN